MSSHLAQTPDSGPSAAIPVSEVFTSLQGEGRLTGVTSFFIRTSGCNLRCAWCDTPYASWSPDGAPRTIDDLVELARASGVRHAVLTGGEPMMFPAIEPLSRALADAGLHITIETAGTIHRDPSRLACHLLSLSPKLANSTPAIGDPRDPGGAWRARHEERRLNHAALTALIRDFPERQLKFVVREPGDLPEIEALLATLQGWRPDEVMLMPEGVAPPDRARTDWMVAACVQRGWRYCPRLHIDLFGNTRGT